MPSLGEDLKKAREERGVTLRKISESTHIGMRFLQAIENDIYDELPGGIFNRSFVRKYAKHVGLDEEQVLIRYDQQLAEKGGEPQKTSVSYLDEERSSSGRFWLPALIFMILCAGAYAAYQYSATTSGDPTPEATTPSPLATSTPTETPAPSPSATIAATSELRLRIAATNGDCWTRVKVDEQPALEKTLRSGEALDFVAAEKLTLDLGNVAAISAELNGRLMKLEPTQGTRMKNVVISKENYEQFLQ
ncbi:MAG: RodZ domain-containing protein [Acidobacteriota bacterium]